MILVGPISELIIKLEPRLYRKHIWYTQRKANALCTIKEGTLWYSTSSPAVLETTIGHITGVGFRN